ncbi:ribosomal protein S18-alanine N-acetyltransferase [Marinobacterium sedimentorum]|uniref:ribosomal protein S18-alanine N-acetyltransferase n=1 Tax=Marinobacterium sedimentorum TaxID=2927804 RepID=UPI0020C5CF36|nr:ribosomal protein S18-alanine N-acetyltransferase [Marinobacterium sedimentorum]MCP8685977.1 ribosomal protein S18-alanine N-acetyltransferase [Marinobacterium sedimentorum]
MAEVRALELADLASLNRLQPQCFDPPWSQDMLRARLVHSRGLNLGIFCDGDLQGFVLLSHVLDEAEVLQIGVAPQYQRAGLARQLLTQAQAQLAGLGIERLMLEVRASNRPALGLYRALGFIEDGRRRGYYPTSTGHEDAVLMSVRPGG